MSGRKAVSMTAKKAAETSVKKAAAKKADAKSTISADKEKVSKKEAPKKETVAPVVPPVVEAPKTESEPKPINQTAYEAESDLKQLLEAGAHFGHQARRWHPKMAPYIYAKRDGVHIFDLIITSQKLNEACTVIYNLAKEGKTVVFVGTKRQAKDIVREEAMASGAGYVVNRWLGGFISNWEQVSKSIKEMVSIRKGLQDDSYKHYTKKEKLLLEKKMQRLERFFGGVSELKKTPDALFIIDAGREDTAIREANEVKIPVIAMIDSNDDPTPVDYVIPANDDAARSIRYIVHAVAEAYKAGREAKQK